MNKRRLPRHVDGRIMIGPFPLKQFLLFLPIAILIFVITIKNISVIMLPIGIITTGLIGIIFAEFNREPGIIILKDTIKSLIEGNKYYERSIDDVPITKRFIQNQKIYEIGKKQNIGSD